jgi:hypothetical protein
MNTLNIFKPLKTIWKCRKILDERPKVKIKTGTIYDYAPIYTPYYWDGDFYKRNFIFHGLIEDITWKTTYGIVQFEKPPRWHFVFFSKKYITITLEFSDNYREYERMLNFVFKYYGK